MMGEVAAFEFRYQTRSPLFGAAAAVLFLGAIFDIAVVKLVTIGGGHVLFNSRHSIIVAHLFFSLTFLFIGAAFVSNVVVRDDQTRFGSILRATGVGKADYLLGRFIGAFAAGALVMAAGTLGEWLGTLMPFANRAMLGPNHWSAFAYGYGLFALPNALIIAAVLFALATATRSTAGTFIGVIGFLFVDLCSQGLLEGRPDLLDFRVLVDPLGVSAYMASSRYLTAAELNAGALPVTRLMVLSRILWVTASLGLLALTVHRFRFREKVMRQRRVPIAAPPPAQKTVQSVPQPRFDARTARSQFFARAAMEARYIFKSPAFAILLVIAFLFTLPGVLKASSMFGVPLYPLTSFLIPIIDDTFRTVLIVIATYYSGELVWRERERKLHEIIDATPLPAWALMLPKMLGLAAVLVTALLAGMAAGVLAQLLRGGVPIAPGEYLRWYLLPGVVDAGVIAALAVFVQAISPGKYAGWGVMALYLVVRFFGPSLGLAHPLAIYGSVPAVQLSDMAGTGAFGAAASWFRLFWAAAAALLLVAAHVLWPRGAEQPFATRVRQIPARWPRAAAFGAAGLFVLAGSWIAYNTLILNDFRGPKSDQRYLAEYEKRFFGYARLPQPAVRHVELEVALYPEERRAEVHGRYRLVNETNEPLDHVHVRLVNRDLELLEADLPASRLELSDEPFGYRIYRLDVPMRPGESRSFAFRTRRQAAGFRASGTDTHLVPNGTDLDTVALTPRIGMSDAGLIEDPATRREYALPERPPLPRLDDVAATKLPPGGDLGWTTADLTISTSADQTPVAPGKRVFERVENGRRIARFVSDAPVKNLFSIQSARYAVRTVTHAGVEHTVYYDPKHPWNVDRMLTAMQASLDYFAKAFGPYQFDQARIVETPAYRSGGHAYANTVAISEDAGFAADLRDPGTLDLASMVAAHEISHQWWGHQVVGARMQGAGMLHETLAQYSALMVLKGLHGEEKVRRLLQFQLDRYLSGRRTQVIEEEPLERVELGQQHIAYGKGALAMYLLQERLGEDAVNRALKRFVERYRFTAAPWPRSVDLVELLREEAKTAEQQTLITDLFERITLYAFEVQKPSAVERADGKWDVTVPVEAKKLYATGKGAESEAALDDSIDIGLFSAEPGSEEFERNDVIQLKPQRVRSGKQVFRFVTDRPPAYAGIDPYNFYIDRNPRDNVAAVTRNVPRP